MIALVSEGCAVLKVTVSQRTTPQLSLVLDPQSSNTKVSISLSTKYLIPDLKGIYYNTHLTLWSTYSIFQNGSKQLTQPDSISTLLSHGQNYIFATTRGTLMQYNKSHLVHEYPHSIRPYQHLQTTQTHLLALSTHSIHTFSLLTFQQLYQFKVNCY